MKAAICASTLLAVFALLTAPTARADEYDDTIAIFKKAGQSGTFLREELRLRPVSITKAWLCSPSRKAA